MNPLIAGMDAGGTQVRVLFADAETGAPVGDAVTVAANPSGEPPLLPPAPGAVVSVCAGITKITRTGIAPVWEATLAARFPGAMVCVVPDYEIAFHAAVPDRCGVCVVAGTGSVAYGENGTGDAVRVGGRGWEWGDEGSGAWLTTEMVRRTLRALDGQAPITALTNAVCAELQTGDPATLAGTARLLAETTRGFLMPLLARLYADGDVEARGLLVGAGGWLASLAVATAKRLSIPVGDSVTWGTAGGVWNAGGNAVREAFTLAVRRHYPGATPVFDTPAPVVGAVRLAHKNYASKRSESA